MQPIQRPFGYTVKFTLSPARTWLSLGPGWAAMAGALSSGFPELTLMTVLQLVSLWLLVDPLLGTLWDLTVQQGLWRRVIRAQLPSPPRRGVILPYDQPGSPGGQFVLLCRRYQLWWTESYWPMFGGGVVTFGVGLGLAWLLGLSFNLSVFWVAVLATISIVLAGVVPSNRSAVWEGRLQSLAQFMLPWLMGILIWTSLSPLNLILALCYGVTYLGGLHMLAGYRRAEMLFLLGQVAAILLLLALRLLPGAALLGVLLASQLLLKTKFSRPAEFLQKTQLYLILSLLAAAWSLGSWGH